MVMQTRETSGVALVEESDCRRCIILESVGKHHRQQSKALSGLDRFHRILTLFKQYYNEMLQNWVEWRGLVLFPLLERLEVLVLGAVVEVDVVFIFDGAYNRVLIVSQRHY